MQNKFCTTTRIILMIPNPSDAVPTLDRLEFFKFSNVVNTRFPDEALNAISEKGRCIIITESFSHGGGQPKTQKVAELAVACKEKNPDCRTILYPYDHWGIDTKLFDSYIDAREHNSINTLFEKIKEYAKN